MSWRSRLEELYYRKEDLEDVYHALTTASDKAKDVGDDILSSKVEDALAFADELLGNVREALAKEENN
jgi:hypothetical protein